MLADQVVQPVPALAPAWSPVLRSLSRLPVLRPGQGTVRRGLGTLKEDPGVEGRDLHLPVRQRDVGVAVAEPDDQGRSPAGTGADLGGKAASRVEAPAEPDLAGAGRFGGLRPERVGGEVARKQGGPAGAEC